MTPFGGPSGRGPAQEARGYGAFWAQNPSKRGHFRGYLGVAQGPGPLKYPYFDPILGASQGSDIGDSKRIWGILGVQKGVQMRGPGRPPKGVILGVILGVVLEGFWVI